MITAVCFYFFFQFSKCRPLGARSGEQRDDVKVISILFRGGYCKSCRVNAW